MIGNAYVSPYKRKLRSFNNQELLDERLYEFLSEEPSGKKSSGKRRRMARGEPRIEAWKSWHPDFDRLDVSKYSTVMCPKEKYHLSPEGPCVCGRANPLLREPQDEFHAVKEAVIVTNQGRQKPDLSKFEPLKVSGIMSLSSFALAGSRPWGRAMIRFVQIAARDCPGKATQLLEALQDVFGLGNLEPIVLEMRDMESLKNDLLVPSGSTVWPRPGSCSTAWRWIYSEGPNEKKVLMKWTLEHADFRVPWPYVTCSSIRGCKAEKPSDSKIPEEDVSRLKSLLASQSSAAAYLMSSSSVVMGSVRFATIPGGMREATSKAIREYTQSNGTVTKYTPGLLLELHNLLHDARDDAEIEARLSRLNVLYNEIEDVKDTTNQELLDRFFPRVAHYLLTKAPFTPAIEAALNRLTLLLRKVDSYRNAQDVSVTLDVDFKYCMPASCLEDFLSLSSRDLDEVDYLLVANEIYDVSKEGDAEHEAEENNLRRLRIDEYTIRKYKGDLRKRTDHYKIMFSELCTSVPFRTVGWSREQRNNFVVLTKPFGSRLTVTKGSPIFETHYDTVNFFNGGGSSLLGDLFLSVTKLEVLSAALMMEKSGPLNMKNSVVEMMEPQVSEKQREAFRFFRHNLGPTTRGH